MKNPARERTVKSKTEEEIKMDLKKNNIA